MVRGIPKIAEDASEQASVKFTKKPHCYEKEKNSKAFDSKAETCSTQKKISRINIFIIQAPLNSQGLPNREDKAKSQSKKPTSTTLFAGRKDNQKRRFKK